ncbi:MAG TPA: DUF3035 domain-containing protein [Sphingomicrobium sp.]|jgi:hypothetical protein
MRKALTAVLVVAAVTASGCAGRRAAADESLIGRNSPLIIPPDFSLAPPVAGTQGLSAGEAQQQAIDTLFGGPAPRSAAEMSLLEQAGRADAPIGIRSTVADPDTRIVDKGQTTRAILAAPATNSSVASAQAGR